MTMRHEPGEWFKSSWSPDKSECVEVRLGEEVGVRDTKEREAGQLTVARCAWTALVAVVKQG
ncbi:DUF397 domain-containing protein [Amycolatopsis sp. NPDC058986]|uniref:DUF397 domain-containing protein n=1 Tax=unclassified Amycolatopsis TaxID=2618356 RepID=UPI003670F54E